jgi:hypothetical protein
MKRLATVPLLVGPLALALAACGSGGTHPQGARLASPSTAATGTTAPTTKANPAPVTDGQPPSAPQSVPPTVPPSVPSPVPPPVPSPVPPLLWPATTPAALRQLQDATVEGHQPWLCDPADVAEAYGRGPLGWPEPSVRRLHDDVYEVDGPAGARATVTVFKPAGPGCVWEITAVHRG